MHNARAVIRAFMICACLFTFLACCPWEATVINRKSSANTYISIQGKLRREGEEGRSMWWSNILQCSSPYEVDYSIYLPTYIVLNNIVQHFHADSGSTILLSIFGSYDQCVQQSIFCRMPKTSTHRHFNCPSSMKHEPLFRHPWLAHVNWHAVPSKHLKYQK